MKEATGQAGLMNIMLFIIGIIIMILAGSIAYSKAFRVKNRIIDIIEKYGEFSATAQSEIELTLTNIGYRSVSVNTSASHCPKVTGFVNQLGSQHLYCVYKSEKNSSGTYFYKVVAFMYFDLPVIGNFIEIPVSGETKIFYPIKEDWKTVQ